MTGSSDMNEFSKKTGLAPKVILQDMQALAKVGILKKVGSGYALTDKAKIALKGVTPVPWNMRFNFYISIDHPTGVSAGSVKEFRELAAKVNETSLEFHVARGDFENWFASSVGDPAFIEKLAEFKKKGLVGEDLRGALLKSLDARYGFG